MGERERKREWVSKLVFVKRCGNVTALKLHTCFRFIRYVLFFWRKTGKNIFLIFVINVINHLFAINYNKMHFTQCLKLHPIIQLKWFINNLRSLLKVYIYTNVKVCFSFRVDWTYIIKRGELYMYYIIQEK